MITVGQLKEYFEKLDQDKEVIFLLIEPSDEKYIMRAFENRSCSLTEHPMIEVDFVGAGKTCKEGEERDREARKEAIFLTL